MWVKKHIDKKALIPPWVTGEYENIGALLKPNLFFLSDTVREVDPKETYEAYMKIFKDRLQQKKVLPTEKRAYWYTEKSIRRKSKTHPGQWEYGTDDATNGEPWNYMCIPHFRMDLYYFPYEQDVDFTKPMRVKMKEKIVERERETFEPKAHISMLCYWPEEIELCKEFVREVFGGIYIGSADAREIFTNPEWDIG